MFIQAHQTTCQLLQLLNLGQIQEQNESSIYRINDEFPAGFVAGGGSFFKEHHEELLHLVKNVEAWAKAWNITWSGLSRSRSSIIAS